MALSANHWGNQLTKSSTVYNAQCLNNYVKVFIFSSENKAGKLLIKRHKINSEQVRACMSACVISNNNICSQDISWNFRGRAGSSPDSTMNTSLEIACVYCQVVRESSANQQYGRGLFSLALQEASNLITATYEFTVCPHDLPSLSPFLSFTFHLFNPTPGFVHYTLSLQHL